MKATLLILLAVAIVVGGFIGYRATQRKPHCVKVGQPGYDERPPARVDVLGSSLFDRERRAQMSRARLLTAVLAIGLSACTPSESPS